jgi:coenzyme F420-reducing hydrogenase beta subunit
MKHIGEQTNRPCSGCGACAAVCPSSAIELSLNDAGFFRAVVREDRCVDCGLCQSVCPRFSTPNGGKDLRESTLFALQSKSEATVQRCSSGGIAHELAADCIRKGWHVCGVVYNPESDRAEHRVISYLEELPDLDGSKYLQSDTSALRQALELAREGANLAVFGTPCQIAGLAQAAEKLGLRDRLLLTEIFCHGVPSYLLWEHQCGRMKQKLHAERFDRVQFRYKKNDWHSYCLRADAGERSFFGARETELFWQVFFENVLLNDACFACEMRKTVSLADLRLGDYWGRRYQQHSDGVSAVFALTERGKEALRRLDLRPLEPGTPDEMLQAQNMDGYHDRALHDGAMEVLRQTRDITSAVKYYRSREGSRQTLKRVLLQASAILPDELRVKLRKANSSRKLK